MRSHSQKTVLLQRMSLQHEFDANLLGLRYLSFELFNKRNSYTDSEWWIWEAYFKNYHPIVQGPMNQRISG